MKRKRRRYKILNQRVFELGETLKMISYKHIRMKLQSVLRVFFFFFWGVGQFPLPFMPVACCQTRAAAEMVGTQRLPLQPFIL